jgi:hypothetical protein
MPVADPLLAVGHSFAIHLANVGFSFGIISQQSLGVGRPMCSCAEIKRIHKPSLLAIASKLIFETLKRWKCSHFRSVPISDSLVELLRQVIAQTDPSGPGWKIFSADGLPAKKKCMGQYRRHGLARRSAPRLRCRLFSPKIPAANSSKMARTCPHGDDGDLLGCVRQRSVNRPKDFENTLRKSFEFSFLPQASVVFSA